MEKPKLFIAGSPSGAPSLQDLIELALRLTGRAPTDEEIAEARKIYDAQSTE